LKHQYKELSFALAHIPIHYKKLSSGQIYYFQAWMLHSCLSIVNCVCIAGLLLVIVQLFKNPPFRWCTKELLSISSSEIQILILTLVQVIFLLYITVYYWSITTSYFYLCTIHTVNCTFLKYKYKENRDPCFAPASMVIRPMCTGPASRTRQYSLVSAHERKLITSTTCSHQFVQN
jgi:hypothetical protein